MNIHTKTFVPPAPRPRQGIPSIFKLLRTLYRNPIEFWGEPSYNEPYIHMKGGIGGPLLIANDPDLIRLSYGGKRQKLQNGKDTAIASASNFT